MTDGRHFSADSLRKLKGGNLSLSCRVAIRSFHDFIGFVAQLQSEFGTDLTFVDVTAVALAHLDAYLTTVVTCFNEDYSNNARGYLRKLHDNTLVTFLPNAFNQRTRCIRLFHGVWSPEKQTICSLGISACFSIKTSRTAPMRSYIPSLKNY